MIFGSVNSNVEEQRARARRERQRSARSGGGGLAGMGMSALHVSNSSSTTAATSTNTTTNGKSSTTAGVPKITYTKAKHLAKDGSSNQEVKIPKGFVDISPNKDGGVLKKLLKRGPLGFYEHSFGDGEKASSPGKFPVEGCPVWIQFVGRLMNGNIFGTTRDVVDGKNVGGTDDPMDFMLLRENKVRQGPNEDLMKRFLTEGFHIAVASMQRGEIAEYIFLHEYGYGQKGLPPRVRPNVPVRVEIEVCYWKDSLPRFPSQEELARSKRAREEEARKQYEENPPPAKKECVEKALAEKVLGNELFAQGKYEEAKAKYDAGFVNVYVGKVGCEFSMFDFSAMIMLIVSYKFEYMQCMCVLPYRMSGRNYCPRKKRK